MTTMQEFGIGRATVDTDPIMEVLATQEAQRIEATLQRAPYITGCCCQNVATVAGEHTSCGGDGVSEAYAAGVMGSGVMCLVHLEAYHKCSVEDAIARKRNGERATKPCTVCHAPGRWVSGAGQYLCGRHANDY